MLIVIYFLLIRYIVRCVHFRFHLCSSNRRFWAGFFRNLFHLWIRCAKIYLLLVPCKHSKCIFEKFQINILQFEGKSILLFYSFLLFLLQQSFSFSFFNKSTNRFEFRFIKQIAVPLRSDEGRQERRIKIDKRIVLYFLNRLNCRRIFTKFMSFVPMSSRRKGRRRRNWIF